MRINSEYMQSGDRRHQVSSLHRTAFVSTISGLLLCALCGKAVAGALYFQEMSSASESGYAVPEVG